MRRLLQVSCLVFYAAAAYAQVSRTCYFVSGPSSGSTQYFSYAVPIPIGAPCNDGIQSAGFAVRDGLVNPIGDFALSGESPSCTDPLGNPVAFRVSNNIPKSGLATIQGNQPVVLLRTSDLDSFSPPVRRFLLAHECGHHALGQVLGAAYYNEPIGRSQELAADCFALRALRAGGRLSDADWNVVKTFLVTVPGDPTTYPGPERVERLQGCN